MHANFTGRRLWFATSSVIIHAQGLHLKDVHLPTLGVSTKGYGNRQQIAGILRASPSASTSTHPRGLLGEIFFECGLFCPSKRTTYIIRVRAFLSLESLSLGQQRLGIIRVQAFLSLESLSSGQQRLSIIRVWAFLPPELIFRASSALVLFECGLSCPSN
jgi:hypothetical protein